MTRNCNPIRAPAASNTAISDGFNFSLAVAVGYIDLFGIADETSVVMVIYLQEALDARRALGPLDAAGIEAATIEGAVHRLRLKLMTVAVVMISRAPILWEIGIGSDVMKPIARADRRFQLFWGRKCQSGRPRIPPDPQHLIRKMARENPGARSELQTSCW